MRVLVAPDCFTGTLSAPEAAEAIAAGWRRSAPGDDLELVPLSDGGPGFVDVLHRALGGRLLSVTVPGPVGEPVPASLLVVDPRSPDRPRTAYVETAQACGLHLVPAGRRDPRRTSTFGVGVLLREARAAGAGRIVVGLGGSGTNDAGLGMLAALLEEAGTGAAEPGVPTAARPAAPTGLVRRLSGGGGGVAGLTPAQVVPLIAVRRAWADVDLVVASDVDVPLLGFHGASAGFAQQKGATPEQAQELERALGEAAAAVCDALGLPRKLTGTAGAGAAGGLGFGLLALGADRVPGAQAVLDAVGFPGRARRSDLVVTGEGSFDWQSLRGKVVAGVARAGLEVGTPVVVVAGQVLVGRREALSIGVESAYPVARTPAEVDSALADPVGTLADRAERVARTWSRAR